MAHFYSTSNVLAYLFNLLQLKWAVWDTSCLRLANVARTCNLSKRKVRLLFERAAEIAISCSYRIFNARSSEQWDVNDLLN